MQTEAEDILLRHGWLSAQPRAFQERLLKLCQFRFYGAGTSVYHLGDPAGGIYGIVAGTLSVAIAPGSTGPHVAHLATPGWWFGEGGFLTGEPRRTGIEALSDCWLAHVSLAQMEKLASQLPEAGRCFGAIGTFKLDTAFRTVEDLLNPVADYRLAATAWRCAAGRTGARIETSQAEIARLANVSRKVAIRVLDRLEALGLIRKRYRSIEVIDADKLRMFADGKRVRGDEGLAARRRHRHSPNRRAELNEAV